MRSTPPHACNFWSLAGGALLACLALGVGPAHADEPTPAEQQIRAYLAQRVHQLAQREPILVANGEQWNARRAELREQLFDMLGLWPLPERTALVPVVVGSVESGDVVVERLHFQSQPGLYVTANFYRPRQVAEPLPTILYLNGHAKAVVGQRSLGNKVPYQHHGCWFARNGYCCLTIDTVQLGEIEGIHHGTYREGMWWWISRGYTPAGVEAWNAIRALDYLATRPEVDMHRIGVTGRSGGGAYSWFVAALDDRPACVVPVAGITDLADHVEHRCIEGHCDCMYMVNSRVWDFATLAALVAPRPCLLSNTDKDRIFPLGGITRIDDRLRTLYAQLQASDRYGLYVTEGPHADSQELQLGAFRWLNRWLRQQTGPVEAPGDKLFPPEDLAVFDHLPVDQRNTTIHEWFVPQAEPPAIPADWQAWQPLSDQLQSALATRCFASWPPTDAPLDLKCIADATHGGERLRVIEFTSEANLRFQLFALSAAGDAAIARVTCEVVDNAGWSAWQTRLAARFPELLGSDQPPATAAEGDPLAPGELRVIIAPRGWGPNSWGGDDQSQRHLLRSFVLVGTTADTGRIGDTRRALAAVREALAPRADYTLAGRGAAAGIALYAGLFEPTVQALELIEPPVSHREGPILLGVLRVLDMPQAVALAFPRKVELATSQPAAWDWSAKISQLVRSGEVPLVLKRLPLVDAAAR